MSDTQQGPGWWQASDLKWYPPAPPRLPPPPRQPKKPSRFGRWFNGLGSLKQALFLTAMVAVVIGAIALAAYLSSRKSAEEKVFLADLAGVQADESDDHVIEVGHDICKALAQGDSLQELTRFFGAPDPTAVALQLNQFLIAATAPHSICPEQASAVTALLHRP